MVSRLNLRDGPRPLAHHLARAADAVRQLLARVDDCHPQEGVDLCEKPRASTQQTTWIIVGVILGLLLVGTLCVLVFFHLKKKKRDQREDVEDQFQMSDYGLDDQPGSRPKKPQGEQRLSFDDLPRPGLAPTSNRNLNPNPFADDAMSVRSVDGLNPPKTVKA